MDSDIICSKGGEPIYCELVEEIWELIKRWHMDYDKSLRTSYTTHVVKAREAVTTLSKIEGIIRKKIE